MKVLVVSSYALLGGSLAYMLQNLLEDEADVVTYCAIVEAAAYIRGNQPDVIVVEATMNVTSAIAAARASAQTAMNTPILMLGADDDEVFIYWAILAGANGYLPRDASPATFVATVRGMARDELGLSRTMSLAVVRRLRQAVALQPRSTTSSELESQLTKREREVIALVRRGRISREIAEELSMAEATVYKHIQHVLSKLHVHNRAQAALLEESGVHVGMEESDVRIGPMPTRTLTATAGEQSPSLREPNCPAAGE
jgi:DNA-binding NarL/FixJ family response regulator